MLIRQPGLPSVKTFSGSDESLGVVRTPGAVRHPAGGANRRLGLAVDSRRLFIITAGDAVGRGIRRPGA